MIISTYLPKPPNSRKQKKNTKNCQNDYRLIKTRGIDSKNTTLSLFMALVINPYINMMAVYTLKCIWVVIW